MNNVLKRAFHAAIVVLCAAEALAIGQGQDIATVLAEARKALGGERLASLKTLTVTGRSERSRPDGTTSENGFEIFLELPDKFMKRDVVLAMGPTSIYRMSGFNGDGLINEVDAPPALSTGGGMIRMMAPGSAPPGAPVTPDEVAAANRRMLLTNKQEFARLALGMFASSFAAYPVDFADGGLAESADGKAHVVNVTGEGGFTARLFIDTTTHLPLMLSWMDKEPLQVTVGGLGRATAGGGGAHVVLHGPGGGGGTPADLEKVRKEMEAALKDAEAKRRVVEYRLFYADYQTFNGIKLPTRVQHMIDGTPTDELAFEKVQVNAKIDPKKFQPTKSAKE